MILCAYQRNTIQLRIFCEYSASRLDEVIIYLCPSGGHCVAGVPLVEASVRCPSVVLIS